MFRRTIVVALWLVSLCIGCGKDVETPIAKVSQEIERSSADVIEVAAPEPPANMKEELAKAKTLWSFQNPNFVGIINNVKSGFVTLQPTIRDQVPTWTKVTLNQSGAGFDAIRFEAVNQVDLLWAFAKPCRRQVWWDLVDPMFPGSPGFADYMFKQHLDVPGTGIPVHSKFIFQQFDGGKLRPGHEYLIFFAFEDENPMDLYIKMRFFERQLDPPEHFTKPQDAAELLGFELPFRFSEVTMAADHAKEMLERHGMQAAMDYLDQEITDTSPHIDRLYYAEHMQQYAVQLLEAQGDRQTANSYFLRSAKLLRDLLADGVEITPRLQELVPRAFYNEACTLAVNGNHEAAMNSLKEAVERGFRNVAWIRGDDDFESLHKLPEFQQLIELLQAEN